MAAPSVRTIDHVSGEQYRYALTNFVRSLSLYISTDFLTALNERPSRIKKSRNNVDNLKNKNDRSHDSKSASQLSKVPLLLHNPSLVHAPQVVTRWTISTSR
jgi:hypothetical protein